jgi:hypothetical protein
MSDATLFALIEKSAELDDGSLMVTGLVSDETEDADLQVADAGWLKTAVPDWFKWGNIREMHGAKAAGVATELELIGEAGHRIVAHVVDPVSVQKVKDQVLKGFSIGIRGARVVKDNKAIGGRIVDGKIVEVSLVDRPANPNCTLTLAKAATPGVTVKGDLLDAARMLVKTEELHEQDPQPSEEDGPEPVEMDPAEKADSSDSNDEDDVAADAAYLVKSWIAEGLQNDHEEIVKRQFSVAQRREAASSGAAMSDGSFPIHNEEDLHNAIRLAGNAKNPEAARRHIMERARAMGLSAAIPAGWSDGHKADHADLVMKAALAAVKSIKAVEPELPPASGRGSVGVLNKAGLTKSIAEVLDTALAPFMQRLEVLEKAPVPGGPARTRPSDARIRSNHGDELLTEIAQLDALSKTVGDVEVATIYRKRAAELRVQYSQLTS